jgi:hypothetical protein
MKLKDLVGKTEAASSPVDIDLLTKTTLDTIRSLAKSAGLRISSQKEQGIIEYYFKDSAGKNQTDD